MRYLHSQNETLRESKNAVSVQFRLSAGYFDMLMDVHFLMMILVKQFLLDVFVMRCLRASMVFQLLLEHGSYVETTVWWFYTPL